jgi:hypothetical protein
MKQILFISISALLLVTLFANSQTRMSRGEYIDQYKALAIKEMHRSGIPASITMAQGCLESKNGNSRLARQSNNHFGIKCRNDWKGARVYHHDDALNECFRKYRTVEESYIDHTDFLMQNGRYSFLFQLGHTNYKAWARGLKKAGYATDPKYANRLIKIIEEEKLYLLDKVGPEELAEYIPKIETEEKNAFDNAREKVIETFDNLKINPYDNREVMIVNGLEAIRAMPGDTYESIAREMDMKRWEIIHYNDLPKDAVQPEKNELIYLERKRYNAPKGHEKHRVQAGQTMRDVAQKYGIKLNRLYRLNRMDKEQEARSGQVLYLRKKKPRE